FARAHTLHATDVAGGWSVVAFTGRSATMADALNAQGGRYGLIVRGAEGDEVSLVDVIDEVHPASDVDTLVRLLAAPFTAVGAPAGTQEGHAAATAPPSFGPSRCAAGLLARREPRGCERVGLGCSYNLTGNGEVRGQAVLAALDVETKAWFPDHVDDISSLL